MIMSKVWYFPVCGYWTDDYSKLEKWANAYVRCPVCEGLFDGTPPTINEWEEHLELGDKYRSDKGELGYKIFMETMKETCLAELDGGLSRLRKLIQPLLNRISEKIDQPDYYPADSLWGDTLYELSKIPTRKLTIEERLIKIQHLLEARGLVGEKS